MTISTDLMISDLNNRYGSTVTRKQLTEYAKSIGISLSTACTRMKNYKTGRGVYELTVKEKLEENFRTMTGGTVESNNLVPDKDQFFVPFGNFRDVKKVISSRHFYPIFITGLSGNGKTMGVEQACAQLNREMIRVNITIETDEDDLIGGFRLVDGNTVWHNGPVIEALERGAVLLLDEIDLASNKILCLQSLLEGKGVFLKKIGKWVRPATGFTVVATANTKGKGSDDGRFIGTNVLNEAFLERFALTFEQEYPSAAIETKILNNYCAEYDCCKDTFTNALVTWAEIIRKTFNEGGVDEVISTRRLVHIIRAYSIFGDEQKAINVCLNRFDDDTKQSFIDLYDKILAPEEETLDDAFDKAEDMAYNEG